MSNSFDNKLDNLRPYVIVLMENEDRDFTVCELCAQDIPVNQYEIHHTKYAEATYYDLRIVCRSCNRIGENVGLV